MRNFVNKNQDVENKIPNACNFIKNSEPELDTIDLVKICIFVARIKKEVGNRIPKTDDLLINKKAEC